VVEYHRGNMTNVANIELRRRHCNLPIMNQAQGLQQSRQQVGVMQEQLVAIQGRLAELQQQLIQQYQEVLKQQHQEIMQALARINARIRNR
jgi:hypothetical protein